MAVGGPQQSLSIPSPSELAGGPVTPAVTPSAVTIMSEALRSGFLNADEIIARTGKRAQLKEQVDIMSMNEQMSPEAAQARQAGLVESLNRSKLGAAQAGAALPLVEPTARLTASEIEEKQAEQTFGSGIMAFKTLGTEAGVAAPITADGKPDWAARAKLGIDLINWKQKRDTARERLIPSHWKDSNDGTQLLKFNKMGELISQELEQTLAKQAMEPFSQLQPGTATAPAPVTTPTATPAATVDVNKLRADAINSGALSPSAGLSDQDIMAKFSSTAPAPVVSVAPTAPASKPVVNASPAVGTRVAGGFSLGPPKSTAVAQSHYTEQQQKALMALTRSLATQDVLLNSTGFDPANVKSALRIKAYESGTLGQLAASVGQMSDAERKFSSAKNAWLQGLLRAESGAAIATKEQGWYDTVFFPVIGDSADVQKQKAVLRKSVEQTLEQVIAGKMNPEEYSTFRDTISSQSASPEATQPVTVPSVAPTVTAPSATTGARYTFRDGKFYEIK